MEIKDIDILYRQIVKGNFMLPEARNIQEKILSVFRLTDEFRSLYGNYLLEQYANGAGVRDALDAVKKYKKLESVDVEAYRDLIVDFVYTKSVLGFNTWEYFAYGFENMPIRERLKFMKATNILQYYKDMNTDAEAAGILRVKYNAYHTLRDFYKREMIRIGSSAEKQKLADFAEKYESFMVKPVNDALGRGVRRICAKDYPDTDALFADVFRGKPVVCEELVVPHSSFVQINPSCVNTLRVFTYNNGKQVSIVCAWMKAGRGDAVVDNAGAGGMLAAIDTASGIVETDAADEMGGRYAVHPDTGFAFKGFQIPQWEEAVAMVKEMALYFPTIPMIGWDIALSADKGWQTIEGNEGGQINVIQIPYQKGMLAELTKRFEWEKYKKAVEK